MVSLPLRVEQNGQLTVSDSVAYAGRLERNPSHSRGRFVATVVMAVDQPTYAHIQFPGCLVAHAQSKPLHQFGWRRWLKDGRPFVKLRAGDAEGA